ncbi:hypothetical protein CEP52_013137 [Fusarium oligoseptatum]|uniref:Uncharacterized protein n=1 Tax=Fusarium oligoseptatum TaxID=2604345 RepID=A0A428SV44_9HYPO|nr:hypothetical protein CEP52_013137 [Fusarium oligoseptatum]
MPGSLQSPSRLGLQLQDYDQVIALSQGNINETLEVHFMRNEKLQDFKALFPTYGLKGKLTSPTVHLIDKENADQAIFYLNFESGKYYYFDHPNDTPQFDEDGLPLPVGPPTRVIVDLLIDFGTPHILNIAWDHCKIPGVPEGQNAKCRAEIRMFLSTHLESVLLKENDHNILGYAIKIDPPSDGKTKEQRLKEVSKDAPHFPPTSVGSEKSDHNAFLFTEMTQFRKMPTEDLRWSGDWFYSGIGGTLAMSRGIFLDQYLARKLQPAVVGPWEMANHIGKTCSGFPERDDPDWALSKPQLTTVEMKSGTGLQMIYRDVDENYKRWTDDKYEYVAYKHRRNEHYWYNKAELSCVIEPKVGEGKITISSELNTDTQRTVKSRVGSWDFQMVCKIKWSTTIDLRAVETGAKLLVGVESKDPIVDVKIVKDDAKVDGTGEAAEDWEREMKEAAEDRKASPLEERVRYHIEAFSLTSENLASSLERSLNSQGRFIFPGGGTFDMKDPIFSKEGHLLIGLTFREGE